MSHMKRRLGLGRLCLLLAIACWPASEALSVCNVGPTAMADSVPAKAGELVFIDVLANDHHPQGLPLEIESPPSGSCSGTVSRDASLQLISYLASASATGSCSFDYVVKDSAGGSDTATVSVIFVKAGNESVVVTPATPALASAAEGVSLIIRASTTFLGMATYQWHYSASGESGDFVALSASNPRYSGTQSAALQILAAGEEDEGWYQLEVIDNSAVLFTGYSEPSHLEVHPTFAIRALSPALQTVSELTTVSWSVETTGGVPDPSVVWHFCSEGLPCENSSFYLPISELSSGYTGQRSSNLGVLAADTDDQGWYRAVVRDGGVPEAAEVISAEFHLRVVERAGPGIFGPKPRRAVVADNCLVTFTVKVVAAESPPTFQWEFADPNPLGLTWFPVSNGGAFSGATTTQLSVDTSALTEPVAKRSYRLRVDVSGEPPYYSNSASFTVKENQLPFKMTGPVQIPTDIVGNTVAIEMEDYDLGGSGKGYVEKSAGNSGNSNHRGTDPVDLAQCTGSGEICIVDIEPEEALSYTLSIEDEGFYELSYRYESPVENQSVIASFSDRTLSEVVTANTQGGSGVLRTNGVYLARPPWTCGGKPTRILTVDFGGGGFKMNRLRFTKQQPPAQRPFAGLGNPASLPGVLQAEEFDVVDGGLGQTVAYKDLDSGNSSAAACGRDTGDPEWVECGVIRDDSAVARQGVELEEDEWLEYSVAVTQAGWYAATFDYIERTTSAPTVRLYLDGSLIQTVLLPPTNGKWLSYRAPVLRLQQAASSVLRLEVDGAPMALDRVDFDRIPNTIPSASFDVACSATLCTFTSTSTDDHGIISHTWRVDGQPLPQTGSVAGHNFPAGGTKVVTLTVTDGDFASDTVVREIEINGSPVASFTSTCDGLLCSFDASASADDVEILSYQWTFHDGAQTTSVSTVTPLVSYEYSAKGVYRIDLVVSDGELSDVVTDGNTEPDDIPSAAFSVECDGLDCFFDAGGSADDGTIVSYLWDFGDGTTPVETSSPTNAEHTYGSWGNYTVSLTVTDDAPSGPARGAFLPGGAHTASKARLVEVRGISAALRGILPVILDVSRMVNKPPVAHLAVSCVGLTCTLDASQSVDDRMIDSYLWDFGDGSSPTSTSTSTIQHTYAGDGSFEASVTVSDGRHETTAVATAAPNTPPVAAFTWQCTALSCSLDASGSSADALTYAWQFGDGASQAPTGSATALHVYGAGGDYTVTLTVADEVQSVVTSKTVVADAIPVAALAISCVNLDCSFDASVSSDDRGIVSYAWSFGDGASGTTSTSTIQHVYPQGGPYTASLIVTDGAQQSSSASQSFSLDGPPVAAFTADCSGLTCSFDASESSDDVGVVSYSWDFGDGSTASAIDPSADHDYSEGQDYTVTLTVSDGAQNDQVSLVVQVDEPPVAAFVATCSALRCAFDASGSEDDRGIVTYDWDFGDGSVISDAASPGADHVFGSASTYSITLSVTDTGSQSASTTQILRPSSQGLLFNGLLPFFVEFQNSFTEEQQLEVLCDGLVCFFSLATSSDEGDDVTYLWRLGDGTFVITEENTVDHTFLTPGEYLPRVTVLQEGIPAGDHERQVTVDVFKTVHPRPESRE